MKKFLLLVAAACCIGFVSLHAQSKPTGPVATVEEAIEAAKEKQKLIFISYGREACGNCQSLKKLINDKKVRLPDFEWVRADVDCDDPKTRKGFDARYRDAFKNARTLPFVVIAKPDGTLVASTSGYMDEKGYAKFVREARYEAKKP
jgi:thioredoxin-related protein